MIINKISIHESDNLFSLTDLHKASGSDDKKRPSRWLRLERTKNFISELNNDLSAVIKSDKKAGTFACSEAVVAYAMYINPAFEVAVIREFLKHAQKKLRMADLHGKAEWHQNRILGKLTRRDNTDITEQYCDYAIAQGSNRYKNKELCYINITKMINSALNINNRDEIDEDRLALLSVCEQACDKALNEGMGKGEHYKNIYQSAKKAVNEIVKLAIPKSKILADESDHG